ncbi:DUF1405 domain-containing protein [Halobacillus sp. ACCC02827]|uniref:DUF1405 domain-containing protein n=1 Tax=Bacillaceae TaxID=186817 RepID=UPI0002A4EA4D|nr:MULTISPECIES: DUF1405 domain-containing protein [Bacillaceae]ELK45321.1 hypothetical protein D479_15262 [Halobacillus sp. BAB-2008]QHT46857.1 DUF1405 domain-containing protein [Bacillus sp. SB49]WJE14079.1 DUF1405 domain-containing protein [Halobacillus sp. ACCC02827]
MRSLISYVLTSRSFLILLFVVNLFGTIYGFIWYEPQLSITEPKFLLFVPDSPTASMFFTIFLGFYLFGRNVPYIEALALITLMKYGVWAVIMNILTMMEYGSLPWTGYMLIISHSAMAVQGVLYAPYYAIQLRHLAFAAVWTLHNDVIDYVFEQMPIYPAIVEHMNEIGYFTFWLSILCITLAYILTQRHKPTV